MIIKRTLQVSIKGKEEIITFGLPEDEKEREEMFCLRFEEYSRRGYIEPKIFPNGLEKDEYDRNGTCTYFIAKSKEKIIGTIRLIQKTPLPTEEAFEYIEPKCIRSIPVEKRAEFGRFIIVPLDKKKGRYLPRGLVMIVMLDVLLEYCLQHDIRGGYSFIKESLYSKMKRFRMPVYLIDSFKQKYPEQGILYKYFTQKNDRVLPIAFVTEKFKTYLEKKFSNQWLFIYKGKTIQLRDSLYVKLLTFLKIL